MSSRKDGVLSRAWVLGLLALIGVVGISHAEHRGAIGVQGNFSDVFDRLHDDYSGGPGINFFGLYHINRVFDVRADVGARFLEGEQVPQYTLEPAPDLRSRYGERTEDMRVIPFTVDLVYRFEDISQDRFWVPFVAAGAGFYDLELTYVLSDSSYVDPHSGFASAGSGGELDEGDTDGDGLRKQNVFDFGWNAKAGVNLHRTSGVFVNLEAGAHFINTRRRWTPMYDVSIGVGMTLPVR